MFPFLASPVFFAHRGACSHAPENTLAAFHLAIDQKARAIELDVQLTKDQEVVVFHDVHLDRTTDGTGRVKDHLLADLKQLNAGISFNPAYQEETIPTLNEVFEQLPPETILNIELKNLHAPKDSLPAKTAAIIRSFNAEGRVLISSFNGTALRKFAQEIPSIPRGRLLYTARVTKLFSRFPILHANFQSIHLSYKSLDPQIISGFKAAGKFVFAYTLNHTEDLLAAVKMGIDGFFTDDPGFARRILIQEGLLIE
jgi:glycerophosphoryl diester phosphodiesterase